MGTAVLPAQMSAGPWDAFADVDAFVDEVLAALAAMGSVATFSIGRKTSASWDQLPSQAASWNRSAMNAAWALMSLPPMFRTCPFLIIAIAS